MSELARVYQIIQIGPEASAGGTVAATRRLRAMTLTPAEQGSIDTMKASGSKYLTITALNQEWTQFAMQGELSPNELIYPLSGAIAAGTVSSAGTGSGGTAYQWVFSSQTSAPDSFKTFTVEAGDSNRAQNYAGVVFTDFTLTIDRTNAAISGNALGQRMNDGFTLSTGASVIGDSLIMPGQFKLYMEDSQGALGTATALNRAFQFQYSISGRQSPIWPINSDNLSYAATVEAQGVTVQSQLTLAADATGMSLLDTMRRGKRKFIRVEGIGGTTAAGGTALYKLRVDFSGEVIQVPSEQTMQELKMMQWTLGAVHDSTWGFAHQVTVVNDMSGF